MPRGQRSDRRRTWQPGRLVLILRGESRRSEVESDQAAMLRMPPLPGGFRMRPLLRACGVLQRRAQLVETVEPHSDQARAYPLGFDQALSDPAANGFGADLELVGGFLDGSPRCRGCDSSHRKAP